MFTLNFVTKFLHVSVSVDRLQVTGPTYIKTTLLSSFDTKRSTWTKMCCKFVNKYTIYAINTLVVIDGILLSNCYNLRMLYRKIMAVDCTNHMEHTSYSRNADYVMLNLVVQILTTTLSRQIKCPS